LALVSPSLRPGALLRVASPKGPIKRFHHACGSFLSARSRYSIKQNPATVAETTAPTAKIIRIARPPETSLASVSQIEQPERRKADCSKASKQKPRKKLRTVEFSLRPASPKRGGQWFIHSRFDAGNARAKVTILTSENPGNLHRIYSNGNKYELI